MQLTQGLRRSEFLFPNRTATICGDRRTTWEELAYRVARLAGSVRAHGAKPDDRIAILALNSDRYLEAYYAIAWAGCVSVPFNTRWAAAEVAHAIDDSRPTLVFVDSAFANEGEAVSRSGIPVIGMDAPIGVASFDQLVITGQPTEDQCGMNNDLAGIFYTGGTTGRSKGVMLSHRNLMTNFFLVQSVAPYRPATVFLHTPPMFHLAEVDCLLGLSALGATHVILPSFDPTSVIEAIDRHQVDALFLVPTMIGMLCETLRKQPANMSSVRRLMYGASAISSALLEEAMKALPNAEFCQGYGQTELSPTLTLLDHADHLAGRLRSAGRPLPCMDVRVVDEHLRPVAQGEVGEIVARGPCVMLGYWNQPELTSRTIIDDWLQTGDAGHFDEEGYLYLVDRVKDMIVSGGENVYSAEVENALMSHPEVLQCAVIGIPDDRWGEKVHAILYLREGATVTEADLITHCEPLIANYKRPKSFDLRHESLPLSGVGKILKTELRKPFWQGRLRNIA